MLEQHPSLAGAVEHDAVIAARAGGQDGSKQHVGDRAVVAVGEDDRRPRCCGISRRRNEIGRHRCALKWNALRQDRRIEQPQPSVERADPFSISREEPRIDWRAEQGMQAGRVEHARPQENFAGADERSAPLGRIRLGGEAVARGDPRFVEARRVAAANRLCDRLDLAKIGPAVGDIGDRPRAEFVKQVVLEQKAHPYLREPRRG